MKTETACEPDPRFRALAGLLAERSVQVVAITKRGSRRELRTRATDLPRELESIAREGGTLEIAELEARIVFADDDVRCFSKDPAVSIAMLKTLAAQPQ